MEKDIYLTCNKSKTILSNTYRFQVHIHILYTLSVHIHMDGKNGSRNLTNLKWILQLCNYPRLGDIWDMIVNINITDLKLSICVRINVSDGL